MSRFDIVLYGPAVAGRSAWLQDRLGPTFTCHQVDETTPAARRRELLGAATAMITVGFDASMPAGPALRLVQVPGIGVDAVDLSALPDGATLCNVGRHEGAVAEFVILQLLEWRHRAREAEALLRGGNWRRSSRLGAPPHHELAGSRVGIIGYGAIGQALARRLLPFEVEIAVASRRRPEALPVGVAWRALRDLDSFLAEIDIAVLAIAATPETVGLIGDRQLAALGPKALLVNVARGPLLEEEALFLALRDGRLGGAILDVWYDYPDAANPTRQPSRFPFHTLANVMMTPHMAGWTRGTVDRRWQEMTANILNLQTGEPFLNVVRPARLPRTPP
jgi:phosphoglycerate dehydrogenase-like enzyme